MRKFFTTIALVFGLPFLFSKMGVVQSNCPPSIRGESYCGSYRWGADLFMSELDLYAYDAGFNCSVLPWKLADGNLIYKGCVDGAGNFWGFGFQNGAVLVQNRGPVK